jgi:menaquinone-dependent protoporphyrinogen IX oxidase
MKNAVFYKSFMGTTKNYARWLIEEVNCDLYTYDDFNRINIEDYSTVVILSPTYIGWMPGVDFITRNWNKLKGRKIIFTAVGMLPPDSRESKKSYEKIPVDIRSLIRYFKIPGKLFVDKGQKVTKDNLKPVIEVMNA